MLQGLNTEIQQITCSDEIDETKSTRTWSKKAAEQLEKLNKDCNNTAGLQALLKVAVGARVMLRRNIDTKAGLVNGAIGTVVAISATQITIKFDHATDPYKIERVKSAFMVMKNYYVYRTQFPLILAYAVTIHKCQGLSLDCAIIDLSSKVFSDGMSYVALSRVKTLSGCTLLLLKTPLLELVQVASRKLTGLGAATVVTCLTLKNRSLENMPSAMLPVLQLLTALPPKIFAFLCLKSLLHLHPRLQLLLMKYKVHLFFIVLMRNGSTSLVAFKKSILVVVTK